MQMDELLDLVDENDIVVASRPRSEIYAENLHNFRVINAFLVNAKGEIWTPRRTAHKRIFPLALDMSVGGHVESGETYDEAFARETFEELRIDIAKVSWRLLAYLRPAPGGVRPRQFMKVYEIRHQFKPTITTNTITTSHSGSARAKSLIGSRRGTPRRAIFRCS